MVDVSPKAPTVRRAVARARVHMRATTMERIVLGQLPKGDVLAVARIAGIMAAKRTAELIPLCHPVPLAAIELDLKPVGAAADSAQVAGTAPGEAALNIEATATAIDRTGVEMEALVAVTVAALTIYDMCKGVDRDITIREVCLVEKTGGRSGTYRRSEEPPAVPAEGDAPGDH